MQEFKLAAKSRSDKGVSASRRAGMIPAVVYGRGVPSRSIEVEAITFRKLLSEAGESSLVDLAVDGGEAVKVLVHETQTDPLRDNVTHIDFLQVNMSEKITTEIPLVFVGESLAVKGLGGTLVKNHDTIEVECLPGDLVREITVDLSSLATFEDSIRVRDLTLPKGIEVLDEPEETVVLVAPPRTDEEMKALESKVESKVEDVQVVEKKKAEEEAEGEAKKEVKKETKK